jgi:hypothetical protein
MKRRNFIKNTGLSFAGIALSNSLFSKNMLENKSFKLKSFEVYGNEALVYFVPKKRK